MRLFCYVLLSIFSLLSCSTKKQDSKSLMPDKSKDTFVSMSIKIDVQKINELKMDILSTGDTSKYLEAKKYYFESAQYENFIYYSLFMANKYNYRVAFYDVYIALVHPRTGESFEKIDKKTQSLALFYLLKSYELDFPNSIYEMREKLGVKNSYPNSKHFLNEYLNAIN
jgi:hypothetical protein